MKNFRQLLKELPSKKVVFTFGRFQPPTIGHELLIKAVKKIAGNTADHIIFASKSEDKKSNPLSVARKVYYLKRMFPNTNFVSANEEVRTFIEAAKQLSKKYKNVIMVAGSDRVSEYNKLLNKYNGTEFHFDSIEVISAGERDPDSDSASGMSGTKMRLAAKDGDFKHFKKGVPPALTVLDTRRLMNDIRLGMGLDSIRESFQLERSTIREQYVAGMVFNVGDRVEDTGGIYEIMDRGANYITVVNESGQLSKKWIDKVFMVDDIKEDIQPGYAPKEITFKGYTTNNLHHSADAAKAFESTINKYNGGIIKDGIAILNALKVTDTYMKINDLHLEQGGISPDKSEVKEWVNAHMKAKESLQRIGEFLHHMDYWDNHGHELQMLMTNYKDEGQGDINDSFTIEVDMIKEQLKFAAADKIKVARIIAATFGVENADKSSSPEQMVNNGLRKIRNKSFTPDMAKVIDNMLVTARLAGIKFDEKLLPTKVAAVELAMKESVEKVKKPIGYKDYVKQKAVNDPDDQMSLKLNTVPDADPTQTDDLDKDGNQSNQDAKVDSPDPQTKTGFLMQKPLDKNDNLRRQKIKYSLGEEVDLDEGTFKYHMDKAIAAHDRNDMKNKEYHLGNANTARHALPSSEYTKHKDLFAKYKQMTEDVYTSDTKEKDVMYKNSKGETAWRKHKYHPKKVTFKASKMNSEPEQSGKINVDEHIEKVKGGYEVEHITEQDANELVTKLKAKYEEVCEECKETPCTCDEGAEHDKMTDDEIDKMIEHIDELEDIVDEYDKDELEIQDTETGETVENDKEEESEKKNIQEVLSRSARMRAKVYFKATSAKRKRATKIALKSHSSVAKINSRAKKLAIKLMKEKIAKKPLNKLTVAEKERLEAIIHKRKVVINRIALKLVSRIRRIENDRLGHKKG